MTSYLAPTGDSSPPIFGTLSHTTSGMVSTTETNGILSSDVTCRQIFWRQRFRSEV